MPKKQGRKQDMELYKQLEKEIQEMIVVVENTSSNPSYFQQISAGRASSCSIIGHT